MRKFAKSVEIEHGRGIMVDGEPFPWHIDTDPPPTVIMRDRGCDVLIVAIQLDFGAKVTMKTADTPITVEEGAWDCDKPGSTITVDRAAPPGGVDPE